MVYKIIQNRSIIFLEAFVISLAFLIIGFEIGLYVEYSRTNDIVNQYKNFEINALDLKLQDYYYQIMDSASCNQAIKENLIFADKIYNTGLELEKFEDANQLSKDLLIEKQRYSLLKTELWFNSISLKKKCNNPFHTVAYIYSNSQSTSKKAEQEAISQVLKKLKDKYGNNIILLPIVGDMNLNVVDVQLRIYNITYIPSIIIDEKSVISGYATLEDIEKYIK